MSDIKGLVKEMAVLEVEANENLETVPANVLPGRIAAKVAAEDRLKVLKQEYFSHVNRAGAVIILRGARARQVEFAYLAQDIGGTNTLDAEALFTQIANPIKESMGDGRITGLQMGVANEELLKAMSSLGVARYKRVDWDSTVELNTLEDVVAFVRERIMSTNGARVNLAWVLNSAYQTAFREKLAGAIVPFVLVNVADEELPAFSAELFGGRSIVVELGDNAVTENDVTKAFKQLQAKVK